MKIRSEITLTATPGESIGDFFDEAIDFVDKHNSDECTFIFNGWRFYYNPEVNTLLVSDMVTSYLKYNNNC